jgi:hypothetical protein
MKNYQHSNQLKMQKRKEKWVYINLILGTHIHGGHYTPEKR